MDERAIDAENHYWNAISARFYLSIPPPLRPVDEDVRHYTAAVSEWLRPGRRPRVLILGVTPEFYFMPWPEGSDILAVDKSAHMIRNVWPGESTQARCAHWEDMALDDESRDVVFCDGGLSFLEYPGELARLAHNLARIMAPGGVFVVRVYDPGAGREDPAHVMADFLAGRVSNSAILKLRLAMALSASAGEGARLDDIWRYYSGALPDAASLPDRTGWSKAELVALEAYAGREDFYYFPTVDEVCAILCGSPGGFDCRGVTEPGYEFHERLRFVTFART